MRKTPGGSGVKAPDLLTRGRIYIGGGVGVPRRGGDAGLDIRGDRAGEYGYGDAHEGLSQPDWVIGRFYARHGLAQLNGLDGGGGMATWTCFTTPGPAYVIVRLPPTAPGLWASM